MPFDGLFTHAMIAELNKKILHGRITKISQPYPNELIITLRAQRKNFPLLLSAHPNYARIQITKIPYNNPPVPTNFTMMLRKYLEGAQLLKISQLKNDRIVYFDFSTRNELGDELLLQLSVEIMGRHSNVILIDQHQNKIIDTIKHIGPTQNRFRILLPGADYIQPPQQDKINPFADLQNKFLKLVEDYPNREVLAQQLQKNYQGFSYEHALYFADQLHHFKTPLDLQKIWKDCLQQTLQPCPAIVKDKKEFFTCFAYSIDQIQQKAASLSSILDTFYQQKATHDRVLQLGSNLVSVIHNYLRKDRKKVKKLQQELKVSHFADEYRIKGELLTTYMGQLKQGQSKVELPNYYDSENLLSIKLSPELSPSRNAQKYFKKYQKLKNSVTFINQQLKLTQEEIDYLEGIQSQIELAEPQDLPDIKLELQKEGYLKIQKNAKKKRPKKSFSRPAIFYSSDQTKISVGKNNLQNDQLTLKTAAKTDIWLHVKNIPGSHVIIHDPHPSQQTLLQAANLAAYFSKSQHSATVPVDYVMVKKIRKPHGARPGFVIYEGQKTLYVTPDEQLIKTLRAKN
jgi:predicted ribosome quality control (RQC) complex YloA/Tae2 family protein